ncbi:efflux RND transporter permease subunit [Haliangium ochraceum]|uniref:Acriflavin resistance protein n=1 Tax=Haliangium ochraceum (strain DSM 14365 / JCM 11303 / SMP-2) TaxID=502025 RepID=D0LNH6_HALO1|nr:efflux RND transporter permease subunit [Haliangium ochraceum]ACY16881.1 acriflavin resistance protein [Haliangium ochraceum DSM 14365]
MLEALLRFSLAKRWLVLGAAALLCVFGMLRAEQMPVDVFPDLSAPRVTVVTESTGMAPEEVERLITFPIEAAVNGVAGVRRVRSASAPGISIVWVEFDWNTGDTVARQRVTERLQALSALPPEASAPTLAPPASVMGEIAFVALSSPRGDALALRRAAEVELRRRLLAVRGVAQVVALGGLEREYQVIADPERLERYQLALADLVAAVRGGNRNAPGGYVIGQGQESVVRVLGRAHGAEDLADLPVALRAGAPVRVRDVADVRVGAALPRGTGSYNGAPAVVLSVVKQPGADTLAVTARVDQVLDELAPTLAARDMVIHRDLFRQADFIERSVDNLMVVLRDGALLVIGVLLVFLWSLRPTLISALALPLSLLTAVLVLSALGMGLDTMTLGGLAIAIGELVDDAIVDVENVIRRLRERAALPTEERAPVLRVVFEASREIRSAIASATAILMLVFLPLLLLEGLEGRLLRPLAIAYLVAIASSLVVAVTVTPVLCSLLLPGAVARGGAGEPPLLRRLGRLYEPFLRLALHRPRLVVAGALAVVAAGALGFVNMGRTFLPEFNEGSLTIAAVTLPGTSLEQSDALGRLAEIALLDDPAVVSTARRTGRAERDEHVQGVEAAEIDVRLRPDGRSKEQLLADIRERLAAVPGVQFTLGQPISHRIDHMLSGQRAALSIKIVGEDLAVLRRVAERARDAVADVPGLVDLSVEQAVAVPQVVVDIEPAAAAQYGLSPGAAAEAVGTALWGSDAGRVYEDGTSTAVVVRYAEDARASLEAVQRTRVPTPSGAVVPVAAFADVRRDRGPNYILRENVARRVVVTANVAGRDLASVYREVRARIDERVQRPEGVHVDYAGQFEREQAAGTRLVLLGLAAVAGIGIIVAATLRSLRRAAIVLVNLPLALAGGVVGVHLGGVFSIASLIGFITLFGIAARNGILLATRTRDLELEGVDRREAVAQSARERLAPILMTAVSAGLGLLPLALALGQPGSEIQAPMALVILTGLSSSTALNMVVVPALLARWGGDTRERAAA